MRNIFLLFTIACALIATSGGQENLQAETAAIRRVLDEQQRAWNGQDLEKFMAGYWNSPELTFFSGAHESKGWRAALDRYRKNYQGAGHEMGQLEFDDVRVEILSSDSAFVRGEFHLAMKDGKAPHGLFTLVFRRFPAGWKIVHDHSSGE